MIDARLYIDGELADLWTDTKIIMNVRSNMFLDISKITSNNTYTIRLPKTVNNKRLLGHSDLVQTKCNYVYRLHKASYVRNGVEIIRNGMASVLRITNEAIEISIFWGLFPSFNRILAQGTTLNQLESDDKIIYNKDNRIEKYAEAKKKNFFYVKYDAIRREEKNEYVWRGAHYRVSPYKDVINENVSFGGFRNGGKSIELHPVVKASYILELIKRNKGVDFRFNGEAKEYIDSLIIPLINKKSNDLTFDASFCADIKPTDKRGALNLLITNGSNVFSNKVGTEKDYLDVVADSKLVLDINAEWQFDISNYRVYGKRSWSKDGDMRNYDVYWFRNGYFLKVTSVNADGEKEEHLIGKSGQGFMVSVPEGYKGIVKYAYKGFGAVEVKRGSKVTFEWLSDGYLNDARMLGGTIKAALQSDENVPYGGYFPIAYNLPKIRIIEFVKFLAAVTGTFPLQFSDDNVVRFVSNDTIWENRAKAREWSDRIVSQKDERKPESIDFVMTEYAQHNWYKWKADSTVMGNYDGDMRIGNSTLGIERTVVTFPFAATDGNNIPMYKEQETDNSTSNGTFGSGYEEPRPRDTATKINGQQSKYSPCKDRILRLLDDGNGNAMGWFDIDIQHILDTKYGKLSGSLQRAKIISEKIRIKDYELKNFDETVPVYLAQYGSYFAVMELKAEDNGTAKAVMMKLNF